MKNALKITLCVGVFTLLTACGGESGDSKGGEPSFIGNWSTKCYAGQSMQSIARQLGIAVNSSVKSFDVKMNNTADTFKTTAFVYSDAGCSTSINKSSKTCSYTNQGVKTSSGGKRVKKMSGNCSGKAFRDVYLIENGNLYLSTGKGVDSEGYPSEIFYDYYFTRQ